MINRLPIVAALIVGVFAAGGAHAACARVTIADMNWPSASLMANVDKIILKHGYGCDAELVPGDTMPTGTSMIEKSEPDIAPELWSNSFAKQLQTGTAEKRLRIAGKSLSDGGEEGFWVPKYMVEKVPILATIDGIKKNAKIFKHPEDPDKSAFVGCPAGWTCQITSGNLFRALKLADSGFELVDPGSAAGLAGSIAKAYERREPWFGYYWAPTAILGKYQMVKVDFGTGTDEKHYKACISQDDCVDPIPTMYPPSPVHTVTTESFASNAPEAYDYLAKRAFTNAEMNRLLVWIEENQADGETAAVYFLKNHETVWIQWVSAAIAAKVPHRTVLENVAFGLLIQKVAKPEREEKAREWLRLVGLNGYEDQYPSQLSGGQQQRVGLARALCTDPEILLMDEPFSSLDRLIRSGMQDLLVELQDKLHKTIVFITHDLDEALRLGQQIAILKDGVLSQVGRPKEILQNPADDYVEAFVRDVNRARELSTITNP